MPKAQTIEEDPLDSRIQDLEVKLGIKSNKKEFLENLKNDGMLDLYDVYPDEQYNNDEDSADMVDSEILVSKATTYVESGVGFESNFEPLVSLQALEMKELVEELANDLLTLGFEDQNMKGKIFLLLLCLLAQPKTKLYLIKALAKLLKKEAQINIFVLSYFYSLGLLTDAFAKNLLVKTIERDNIDGFRTLIGTMGVELRTRDPKSIIDLQDEVANISGFHEYVKEIKKLKNNLIEANQTVEDIKSIKTGLRSRLRKYGELSPQLKLLFDIEMLKSIDIDKKGWWKQLVIKKVQSQESQTKALLLNKYQKTIEKLGLSNDKQIDILLIILQSENFAVAAKTLNEHLLKEKNYNDSFFVIVELIFHEKKINQYYVYLLRDLLRLSKTVQLKLKKFIWMYYSNKLNDEFDQNNMELFIDLVVEIVALDFYGLKIVKGFDFFTDQSVQQAFNKSFLSKLIRKVDRRFIITELKKLGSDKKNSGTIQELKDYVREYIETEIDASDTGSRIEVTKLELIKDFDDYIS